MTTPGNSREVWGGNPLTKTQIPSSNIGGGLGAIYGGRDVNVSLWQGRLRNTEGISHLSYLAGPRQACDSVCAFAPLHISVVVRETDTKRKQVCLPG